MLEPNHRSFKPEDSPERQLFYNLQRNNNDVINYGKTSSYSHY